MEVFPEPSFFKESRASDLPTPAEVRAINRASGNICATNFNRPPPVMIPSLCLVVKYGADVTIVEPSSQMIAREKLIGKVPMPEAFGWTEDGGQRFIYVSLIEGETLQERWCDMNDDDRRTVCLELKHMVKAWRALKQDKHDFYIGNFGKQPLKEVFLESHPELAGPFQGANAVQRFQDTCGIEINSGPNPKVTAIIDWGQAGWYPAYWKYCKARRVRVDPEYFDDAVQEEWYTKYLPTILDPEDDETYYYPWLCFLSVSINHDIPFVVPKRSL
ncbi:phosphotransferase enzyme family protein [Penicillium brevicompactum]